jgi:hypothetical protein
MTEIDCLPIVGKALCSIVNTKRKLKQNKSRYNSHDLIMVEFLISLGF